MKRAVAMVCLFLAGCGGEPTLDATSDESAKASMDRMVKSLPKPEAQEFARALVRRNLSGAFEGGMAKALKEGPPPLHQSLKPYHGLTAKQIIAKAKADAPAPAP